MAQWVKNPPGVQELQVRSLGREAPLEEEMAIHSVFLPRKSHGQRGARQATVWRVTESPSTEPALKNTGPEKERAPSVVTLPPFGFLVFYLAAPGLSCGVWDLAP